MKKFLLRGFITVYYGILRIKRNFITDITGLLLVLLKDPEKSSLIFGGNRENSAQFITDITEFTITEYNRGVKNSAWEN